MKVHITLEDVYNKIIDLENQMSALSDKVAQIQGNLTNLSGAVQQALASVEAGRDVPANVAALDTVNTALIDLTASVQAALNPPA